MPGGKSSTFLAKPTLNPKTTVASTTTTTKTTTHSVKEPGKMLVIKNYKEPLDFSYIGFNEIMQYTF